MKIVGRKPALTPEQVRAVREWAAFGRSAPQVARNLGIGYSTLRRYLAGEHKRRVA